MRFYLKDNVWDAALKRINWIFDEFPNVVTAFSGGKDSTVVLQLALKVAKERQRILPVIFIDQEAEWRSVIEYARTIRELPGLDFRWYQMPLQLFNSASADTEWLQCWQPGSDWMRPKEPGAITENIYGTTRFKDLFTAIINTEYAGQSCALLGGVRCEESPRRNAGLTVSATYKHITWGKAFNKKEHRYNLSPLYDWSYTDIWKAIHKNNWAYCKIYDYQYQYGVPLLNMRVSNLHHETAVNSLFYLQEVERDTFEALAKRLPGIHTIGQMKSDAFDLPAKLPYMFESWKQYRDHLCQNLIVHHESQVAFQKRFSKMDIKYEKFPDKDKMYKAQLKAMLANDWEGTLITNWESIPWVHGWYQWTNGKEHELNAKNPYIIQTKNKEEALAK